MEFTRLIFVHLAIGLAIGLGMALAAVIQKGGRRLLDRRRDAQILDSIRLIAYLGALSKRRQWVITKGLATAQSAEPSTAFHPSRLV